MPRRNTANQRKKPESPNRKKRKNSWRRQVQGGFKGHLYETRLLMYLLIKAMEMQKNGKKLKYCMDSNISGVKYFDDIVFRYEHKGMDCSKTIFLQAKHFLDPDEIVIDEFLNNPKVLKFSLRSYFETYFDIQEPFSQGKRKRPLLKSDLGNRNFIIFSNALPHASFETHKNVKRRKVDEESILYDKKIKDPYELILGEDENTSNEILYTLPNCRQSLNKVIDSIFPKNGKSELKIQGSCKIYEKELLEKVFTPKDDRKHRFSETFLNGETKLSINRKDFLDELLDKLSPRGQKFKNLNLAIQNDMTSKLNRKIIKLPENFGDSDVNTVLGKLKIFLAQPGEDELEKIIFVKLQKLFCIPKHEKAHYYYSAKVRLENWYKNGKTYLTEKNLIFREAKDYSVTSGVKSPAVKFTGRKRELEELHEMMQKQSKNSTFISQTTVVCGLGGVGKTELARRYIHDYSKFYDNNVFWINSTDEKTFTESFLCLAKEVLEIEVTGEDGKQKEINIIVEDVYKSFRGRKCLFVFDDAPRYKTVERIDGGKDFGMDRYLMISCLNATGFSFLITSRNQDWGYMKMLSLDPMNLRDSTEFIRNSLSIRDYKMEKGLAKKMQGFPLALNQAVAYIKDENDTRESIGLKYDINDYLRNFEKEKKKYLSFDSSKPMMHSYSKTTYTTWDNTIEMIKKDEKYGQLAIEILSVISFFPPGDIPVKEVSKAVKLGSEVEVCHAIKLLKQYSMITTGQQKTKVKVHTLVQEVMKLKLMDEGNYKKFSETYESLV